MNDEDVRQRYASLAEHEYERDTDRVHNLLHAYFDGFRSVISEKITIGGTTYENVSFFSDLEFNDKRCLQAAARYASELQRDKGEHGIAHMCDARSAAILAMEVMRASPVVAPHNMSLPAPVRAYRGQINFKFAVFVSAGWMNVSDIRSVVSKDTIGMLGDALQFRSGCRHTLAVAFQIIQDAWMTMQSGAPTSRVG